MYSQAGISHADNGIRMLEMDATVTPARRAGRLPYGRGRSASPRPRRGRNPPPGTWNRERIVVALRDWKHTVGEPPRSYDWSPPLARALGRESARSRRWDAEHPRWPHALEFPRFDGHGWACGHFLVDFLIERCEPRSGESGPVAAERAVLVVAAESIPSVEWRRWPL